MNPNAVDQSFYRVGSNVYKSKLMALLESTATNVHPTWYFGDDSFDRMKWDEGVVESITPFYLARARQLREKYDYLILTYSGGADSRTMFDAFVKQKIYPDEIIVSWPRKATENLYTPSLDRSTAVNMLSEWDYVIKDDLEYITANYPKIKVTHDDYSEEIVTNKITLEDDNWFTSNDHLNINVYRKFCHMTKREKEIIDSGKSNAIVWGIDKPQICYKEGSLWLYFLDKLANTRSSDQNNFRTSELFYWSPDFPELVHAQARLVYEHFKKNPHLVSLVDWENKSYDPIKKKNELNLIIKNIVYPNYSPLRFQAAKPTNMVWEEHDTWFWQNYSHTKYFQSWVSGLDHLQRSVDRKFQQIGEDGKFEGWVGFINRFYNLGKISKINTQ